MSPFLLRVRMDVASWLSALCAPELADLELSRTDEGSVMLRLVEKDGIKVSARSLSDGTLRFLGELIDALGGEQVFGEAAVPGKLHSSLLGETSPVEKPTPTIAGVDGGIPPWESAA